MHNLEYIAAQAALRKSIVSGRRENGNKFKPDDLIAQTPEEVELFDSIDCLSPGELTELKEVAVSGGLVIDEELSVSETVEKLYFEIDLDIFLVQGINKI